MKNFIKMFRITLQIFFLLLIIPTNAFAIQSGGGYTVNDQVTPIQGGVSGSGYTSVSSGNPAPTSVNGNGFTSTGGIFIVTPSTDPSPVVSNSSGGGGGGIVFFPFPINLPCSFFDPACNAKTILAQIDTTQNSTLPLDRGENIQNQTTPLPDFKIIVSPPTKSNKYPSISFQTDPSLRIDHYEMKVTNLAPTIPNNRNGDFFMTVTNPATLNLDKGEYDITIRAYDKAGNYQEATKRLFVGNPEKAGRGFMANDWLGALFISALFLLLLFIFKKARQKISWI
jgi:hypothetical protein